MITREGAGCHLHIQTADVSLAQKKGLVQRCSRQEEKENGKVSRGRKGATCLPSRRSPCSLPVVSELRAGTEYKNITLHVCVCQNNLTADISTDSQGDPRRWQGI